MKYVRISLYSFGYGYAKKVFNYFLNNKRKVQL